jgi:hypothetical protein
MHDIVCSRVLLVCGCECVRTCPLLPQLFDHSTSLDERESADLACLVAVGTCMTDAPAPTPTPASTSMMRGGQTQQAASLQAVLITLAGVRGLLWAVLITIAFVYQTLPISVRAELGSTSMSTSASAVSHFQLFFAALALFL